VGTLSLVKTIENKKNIVSAQIHENYKDADVWQKGKLSGVYILEDCQNQLDLQQLDAQVQAE
jgi:hypothetical protein